MKSPVDFTLAVENGLPSYFPLGSSTKSQSPPSASDVQAQQGNQHIDAHATCTGANLLCSKLTQVKVGGWPPHYELSFQNVEVIHELLRGYTTFEQLNDVYAQHPHSTHIQLKIFAGLQAIIEEVERGELWAADNESKVFRSTSHSEATKSAEMVWALWDNVCKLHKKLSHFAATGQTSGYNLDLW